MLWARFNYFCTLFFMNPTEIQQALSALGGRANKALGQHFLVDPVALQKIVDAAELRAGESVLEIGPGLGVLTNKLLEAGVHLVAIEQDRRFLPGLETNINDHGEVIHGNAIELDWSPLFERKPWKLVANLPYSITSFAIRKALYDASPATKVVVLIQKEVADRAIAKDGKLSLLSLMIALATSSSSIASRVPPGAFFPPPKVDSSVLVLDVMSHEDRRKKWGIDPEQVMKLAKKGFAHPRKKMFSNLGMKEVEATAMATLVGISPMVRSEDVNVEQWVELAKKISLS